MSPGDGGLEMDMLGDLESLQFEYGIQEEDRSLLYLQGRSRGLVIKTFAHATFCKLLCYLRELLHEKQSSRCLLTRAPDDTLGDDVLKKSEQQLLLRRLTEKDIVTILEYYYMLYELQKLGIQCFYHNTRLVGWANVIFLCCLPSQLPKICVEIQTRLERACTVYSFVAAVPIPRLKLLLNHTSILWPQYQCSEDFVNIWGANKEITTALRDPVILQATCPYSPAGGVILNIKWLEGVFYAALNICTAKEMPCSQALRLLNELFLSVHFEDCGKDGASCPKFQLQDFVSKAYAKNLTQRRPFPWFDLTAVQLKKTPFSQHLSTSASLQDHLTHLYCDSFGISLTREEQPVVSSASSSQ
ncbi:NADP-dependent oxidoreductase domain-containing protein 1 [Manis javanica]|nr:NADP-dependent oxidoreductase domain-containing protein 1 [Manis javanica]